MLFLYSVKDYARSSTDKTPRILAATCVERMPVISSDMNEIETRYSQNINKRDVENSYKSDHELRHLSDM
jgi:hypothetical protein